MIPVKRIGGYGRFTARGDFVVATQHSESLKENGRRRSAMSGTE
jgi:hypothetical protein